MVTFAVMKNVILLIFACVYLTQTKAQCAMCQASAESSLDAGSTAASGLNNGILYLLVLPFAFAFIFYILYKRRQQVLKKL